MRTQAIIIKKIPIREDDELIVCYTRDNGKQTYQAKSVKKAISKQASHLDIFNLTDFSLVKGNGHPIITGAHSLRTFSNLKSSLPALATGYCLLECFDKLVFEGESDPELWDFLNNKLEQYDSLAKNNFNFWATAVASSRKELLEIMGHGPDANLEELVGGYLKSLQFARKVIL